MQHLNENQARWIWYPGDFEIRHGLMQNFQREERKYDWPAYWYVDDCRKNVKFTKCYQLDNDTTFTVYGDGIGYVEINKIKYPLNTVLQCKEGLNEINVYIGNIYGLPSAFIDGDIIKSNETWMASDFSQSFPVGWDDLYSDKHQKPNTVNYSMEKRYPEYVKEINGGVLFDFGRVVNGCITIDSIFPSNKCITLCFGESEAEALDVEMCYYKQENVVQNCHIRKRAFKYVFIPECKQNELNISAEHQFIPKNSLSSFTSNDKTMNKIWEVSEETFRLCSDMFFIDGVKRDRWIWSGDAFQCYLINQYVFFDEAINKRTMVALRGRDNIKQHINTIVDYSILWIISIENHYLMTKDKIFLERIYRKMVSMVEYLDDQTNEHGFIYGRKNDWVFIDWAEIDKDGTISAEQILMLKAYQTMINCGKVLNISTTKYQKKFETLSENIDKYFWDEELGAYIDCYESGRRNITRHANIFAVLFDLVCNDKKQKILTNVLLNKNIPQITTPYFKFFELDALCKLGELEQVYHNIILYWGGMLELGAVTFWEEFNPEQKHEAHYSMYGDPYGKSLCHAWSASPIYLLGRYFFGLYPTKPGYEEFIIEPNLNLFTNINCTLPVKDGVVNFNLNKGKLTISTTRNGGLIKYHGTTHTLLKDQSITLNI